MQDKEFDQLFKDRFEEAEIQPSATLWDAIQTEITPVRKRTSSGWWMAAAAVVLIAVSAGLLFNKSEKIQLQGKAELAQTTQSVPAIVEADPEISTPVQSSIILVKAVSHPVGVDRQLNNNIAPHVEEKSLASMQPKAGLAHPLTIENETLAKVAIGSIQENTDVVIASADIPATTVDAVANENEQTEHTKIRNVGDLINFVVEKVDKREQKFLQFKSDDDDNSSLVAINIGPFKLNARKHK